MNLEVETKLSVPLDFNLPKQALTDLGFSVNFEPVKQTDTTYFDSSNFDLLSCGAALRFRGHHEDNSRLRKGVWTLKFSTPQRSSLVSRYEYEVTGSCASIPREFEKVLNIFGRELSLRSIARLEAERTTVDFKGSSGSKLFQIDDDVVTVRSGTGGELKFREIEVELSDPVSGEEANRVVALLREHGAELSRNSSKLELALLQDLTPEQLHEAISRHDADVVNQMIKSAFFVLGKYESLSRLAQGLSDLLIEQSCYGWRLKLVDLLFKELQRKPKLDRFALPALLERANVAVYQYCKWLRTDGGQDRSSGLAKGDWRGIDLRPFLSLESKVQEDEASRAVFAAAIEESIINALTVTEVGD